MQLKLAGHLLAPSLDRIAVVELLIPSVTIWCGSKVVLNFNPNARYTLGYFQ